MYRHESFDATSRSDRIVFICAVCAALILAGLIGCGARGDTKRARTVSTPVSAPTPTRVAPHASVDASRGEVTTPPPRHVTFADAQAVYDHHNYQNAVQYFEAYVAEHPANAYGQYMLGLSAWKMGDLTTARAALERSLDLDSTNVRALLNLGRVLMDQGHPDEARVPVGAAIEIDTGLAESRRMMARVQAALGDRDSAEASYRLALSIDPADAWSMNNLGLLLIDEGRYDDALGPLARAVQLRANAPAFENNLGVALERTGHPSAAADAYRAALAVDSTYGKAARALARVEVMSDTTSVDVDALASSFNDVLQTTRQTRLTAKAPTPDRIQDPE